MTQVYPHILTHLTTVVGAEMTSDCGCETSAIKENGSVRRARSLVIRLVIHEFRATGRLATGWTRQHRTAHTRRPCCWVQIAISEMFETRSTATSLKIGLHGESDELY